MPPRTGGKARGQRGEGGMAARRSPLERTLVGAVARRLRAAVQSASNGLGVLSWDALRRGVQTYIAQQALSPSGPWTQCYVGKASSCTVTGLTSGTQYWFQVCAIGAPAPAPGATPPPNAPPERGGDFRAGQDIFPGSGLDSLAPTCQKAPRTKDVVFVSMTLSQTYRLGGLRL